MDPADEDAGAPEPPLSENDEADLRDLESRIEKLQQPVGGGSRLFARGVALVSSMGFILAGCIFLGDFLGRSLALRFGSQAFHMVGLVLGLAAAVISSVKLLKPFLKSED